MKNMKRPFILILIALLPMVSTVSTAQSKSFDKYEIRAGTDVYKWLLATNETSYRDLGWAVDAAYHWGLESTYDLALSFSLQGGRRRHHSAYNLDFINPSLIMSAYRNIPLGTNRRSMPASVPGHRCCSRESYLQMTSKVQPESFSRLRLDYRSAVI